MKLFVTGICGRLGRAIAREAAQQQVQVVGLDIVDWPEKNGPLPRGVTVHRGSYEDLALVEPLLAGCTAVIHCGGPHGGHVKTLGFDAFIHAHTVSLVRLLDAARKRGVTNAVLSSTMEVLIGRNWSASGAAYLDERSTPATDSAYSMSRYLMECFGQRFARQTGMSIASLRYMAFGYSDDTKAGPHLLARTVPVADVARAVLLAAAKSGLAGEIFNIGPETPITAHDIGDAIADPQAVIEKHFPGAAAILESRKMPIQTEHLWPVTSIQKARLILHWEPHYTFRHWLLENGWQAPSRTPEHATASK